MSNGAIIFDLDNTLINRRLAYDKFAAMLVDQFVDPACSLSKLEMVAWLQQADRNGYRNKRELYAEVLGTLPMKDAHTTGQDLLQFWFAEFFKCTVLMEGALELLQQLKSGGWKLGLITNGSVRTQNMKIDRANLRPFFDAIIVSDAVGLKKPDERIFALALSELGAEASNSWYIGDHPVNDIQGARAAGLRSIWLEGFMAWDAESAEPNDKISHLGEVARIVGL